MEPPNVTSGIGAEGMHGNVPWCGFVEDDSTKFVEKAVELYTKKDLWELARQNGVKIINSLCEKEKSGALLIRKIKTLQTHLTGHRVQNFMGSVLQYHTLQSTKYMSKWIEEKNRYI